MPQTHLELEESKNEEEDEETRPQTRATMLSENERFMTEDEDLQFCKITETTWEMVQKSRKRMDELQKLREGFRVPKFHK